MVAENLKNIRERIAATCVKVDRAPEEVMLIAVTKTFGVDLIRQAMLAGVADFGENYVQEVRQKHDALGDARLRWHFIGHLQSNKVKDIVPWIHCIHAVDSMRLGALISQRAEQMKRNVQILVEVNTSGEVTKFGLPPGKTTNVVKDLSVLPNIEVRGLMTIGPFLPDPESSRPAFRLLRDVKTQIEREGIPLKDLSMGMTNDFEVAIEEGATMLRIGTAIFGKRTTSAS